MSLHAGMQKIVVLHPEWCGAWVRYSAHALGRWYSLWRWEVVHQVRMCSQEEWREEGKRWCLGTVAEVGILYRHLYYTDTS